MIINSNYKENKLNINTSGFLYLGVGMILGIGIGMIAMKKNWNDNKKSLSTDLEDLEDLETLSPSLALKFKLKKDEMDGLKTELIQVKNNCAHLNQKILQADKKKIKINFLLNKEREKNTRIKDVNSNKTKLLDLEKYKNNIQKHMVELLDCLRNDAVARCSIVELKIIDFKNINKQLMGVSAEEAWAKRAILDAMLDSNVILKLLRAFYELYLENNFPMANIEKDIVRLENIMKEGKKIINSVKKTTN